MKIVLLLLVLLGISFSLPLPNSYPGYKKGALDAPVFFEFFGDFQCPYTKSAWDTLVKVLDHYGEEKIRFIFHVYPIWSHRQAWDAAKAVAVVVNQNQNPNVTTWDIIDYFLDNQIDFFNFQFVDKTETDLFNLFAGYANNLIGLDKSTFMTEIASQDIYLQVDHGMHFGVGKSILGTPSFYINGFPVQNVDSVTTVQEWIKVLDPLTQ